jgi:glycopeptide antibiotics resistance protein
MADPDRARDQRVAHAPPTPSRWRLSALPLWFWWIALVWAISFPWGGLTARPHWNRVHWIPFADPADKPRDVVANIMLFLPFGYSFAGRRAGPYRVALAVLVAGAVSFSAEAIQLFSRSRFPSATDVSSALAGTAAGAAWRAWGERAPD